VYFYHSGQKLTIVKGANIRISNIFKLTPEMQALLSTLDETDCFASAPDDIMTTNSRQNESTDPNNSLINPTLDPFSNSNSRQTGGGALFRDLRDGGLSQKLNESTANNKAASMTNGAVNATEFEGMETPPSHGGSFDSNIVSVDNGWPANSRSTTEPPHAPARRNRTFQGLGVDFSIDVPPKMPVRISGKSRVRTGSEMDEASDGANALPTALKKTVNSSSTLDRKRNISGQATHPSSVQTLDPTAAPQRRSVRLFNQIRPTSSKLSSSTGSLINKEGREVKKPKAPGTRSRPAGTSTVGRVVSGNRKPTTEDMDVDTKETRPVSTSQNGSTMLPKSDDTELLKREDALRWLLDLFKKLGGAYFALSHFRCHEALGILTSVPKAQQETPWVLAQMGRAYYEQGSYTEADLLFKRVRSMAPTRLEDMEVYSTVLWHLKKDTWHSYPTNLLILNGNLHKLG
jgi:anaphase-promoting complex subunit 3